MNRISAIALFVAATFASMQSASAQSRIAQATVPFSFSVNNTTLPAGTYFVSSVARNMLKITSADHKHPNAVTFLTNDTGAVSQHGSTRLVFNAYGNEYFLRAIICPSNATDVTLPVSTQEEKVSVEWASKSGGEPLLVALK